MPSIRESILLLIMASGVGLIAFVRHRTYMPKPRRLAAIIGGVLIAAGLFPAAHEFWSDWRSGMRDIEEQAALAGAESTANAIKAKAEHESIRLKIAAMPLPENRRVYYLQKLDPQRGLLGHRSEVSLEQAREVLKEAEASLAAALPK